MTFNKNILSNFKSLGNPIMVTLPNSDKVKVTHDDSVTILPNLILHNVLYIPSFKLNPLSFHKLCKQLNHHVLFISDSCFLQGSSMKQPLEIDEQKCGLYILKSKSKAAASRDSFISSQVLIPRRHCFANPAPIFNSSSNISVSNVKENLWHYRLDHVFNQYEKKFVYSNISLFKFSVSLYYMSNG